MGPEEATESFQRYTHALVEVLGARPEREVLEQHACFAAAVWNAVVILGELGEEALLRDIIRRVKTLEEPEQSRFANLLVKLAMLKARGFKEQVAVFRHVHVVRTENDELRIRAEVLSVDEWLASGQALRMGLVD